MRRRQQPAMYAWQAALLLKRKAPRARVEKALRDTLVFWARFDDIDVPPLLRHADVQAFEHAFLKQLQFKPRSPHGANAAALDAVRHVSWELRWVPF